MTATLDCSSIRPCGCLCFASRRVRAFLLSFALFLIPPIAFVQPAVAVPSGGAQLAGLEDREIVGSGTVGNGPIQSNLADDRAPRLSRLPDFTKIEGYRYVDTDKAGRKIRYTLDIGLQERAEEILKKHRVSWGAIVAVNPQTGQLLAIASNSPLEETRPTALRATFPAASLIKSISAASAVERAGMKGSDLVFFRGGDYTLERYNYLPDAKRDKRVMSLEHALGKSVNPVFGRLGMNKLSRRLLERYAEGFGFNQPLGFELPLERSSFAVGLDDYSLARTAAGFGDVYISPVHAALVAAAFANGGVVHRPQIVDEVRDGVGNILYSSKPSPLLRAIQPETAREVQRMMVATTTAGTARRFFQAPGSVFRNLPVAGKTGTLSGVDPKGKYFWFMGSAPAHAPEIAVSALVIETAGGSQIRGSGAARHLLEYYFRRKFGQALPQVESPTSRKSRSFTPKRGRSVVRTAPQVKKKPVATKRVVAKRSVPKKVVKKSVVKKNTAKKNIVKKR